MKLLKSLFFLFLLCLAHPGYAQEAEKDPIDVAYQACLGNDTSTANLCDCAFVAYSKWNGEMNNAYKKLLKTLKKDKDKTALKQSQLAWAAYRDAEFKSYDFMFNLPGNRYCGIRQDGRIDIVKARALQLRSYQLQLKKQ